MLTNNKNIEKLAYRQVLGGSARNPSTNENIERLAYRQLRNRVRSTLQQGTINYIVGQEISSMIAEALNTQLAAERDNALGRLPYERLAGSGKRNGFKLLKLPGRKMDLAVCRGEIPGKPPLRQALVAHPKPLTVIN